MRQQSNIGYYRADVVSYSDYYPFGAPMTERTAVVTPTDVRYGFNGKEVDSEGMGGGLSTYDYGFRIYNPQIAKFLSTDPLSFNFAFYSPYQYAGNTPVIAIDMDGLEDVWVHVWRNPDGTEGSTAKYSNDPDFKQYKEQMASQLGLKAKMIPPTGSFTTYQEHDVNGNQSIRVSYTPAVVIDGTGFLREGEIAYIKAMGKISDFLNSFADPASGYEFEDFIQSAEIGVEGEFSFNKYSVEFGAGIYSTNENTAGIFGSLSFGVSADTELNFTNFDVSLPKLSPYIAASTGNDYVKKGLSIVNETVSEISGSASIIGASWEKGIQEVSETEFKFSLPTFSAKAKIENKTEVNYVSKETNLTR